MFVRNSGIGLFLDAKDFKTLELEKGTHNGQPVYRVAFKFLYMQGVAVFTVAIFSEKEDAQKCYNELEEAILANKRPSFDDYIQIIDVQNKVKESLIVMPDQKEVSNVVELEK